MDNSKLYVCQIGKEVDELRVGIERARITVRMDNI
jgi:hypothetical protein